MGRFLGRLSFVCLVMGLLALAGCAKPVPPEKAAYVGEWQSDTMALLITAEGRVVYERQVGSNGNKSIDGPLKAFEGDDFVVGVGPVETTFVVSTPPHEEDGEWKMTVDGEELVRM